MNEMTLIRKIRSEIAEHIHYKMDGENWSENKYLVQVVEDIDYFLKQRDKEFDEYLTNEVEKC